MLRFIIKNDESLYLSFNSCYCCFISLFADSFKGACNFIVSCTTIQAYNICAIFIDDLKIDNTREQDNFNCNVHCFRSIQEKSGFGFDLLENELLREIQVEIELCSALL